MTLIVNLIVRPKLSFLSITLIELKFFFYRDRTTPTSHEMALSILSILPKHVFRFHPPWVWKCCDCFSNSVVLVLELSLIWGRINVWLLNLYWIWQAAWKKETPEPKIKHSKNKELSKNKVPENQQCWWLSCFGITVSETRLQKF